MKRFLAMMLALLMLTVVLASCNTGDGNGADTTESVVSEEDIPTTSSVGLEFYLNEDGTGYILYGLGTCTDKDIVVDTYNNMPITTIAQRVFQDAGINSIQLGEGVKIIDSYAFFNCTGLQTITIPASVTAIGACVFKGCTALTTVYFRETDGWVRSGRITPEDPETMDDAEGMAETLKASSDYWNRS